MASKVMHGARAILWVGTQKAGIFNNVSYQVNYDISPAYILGRFSAGELVYTGVEVISISASGFRVMKNGPMTMVPKVQDLMNYDDISVSLYDRAEPDPNKGLIMNVVHVKPAGFSSSVGARSLQDTTVNLQGLHYSDEEGESTEGPGAAELPAD